MPTMEELDLLRAAVAVALADGELRRAEKGVLEGLATRAGVGRTSFEAMVAAAERGELVLDNIIIRPRDRAERAIELLVAQARIDGHVAAEEREVIVRLAIDLGIAGDDFARVYEAGIQRADQLRKTRRPSR